MFSLINRTVFDIRSTWDRTRFETTRAQRRQARKLIEISINVQFDKQLKHLCLENVRIEQTITATNEHLLKHEKKGHIFDELTEITSHSFPNHLTKRVENIRSVIEEHYNAIQKVLHEENEYWKELQSVITSGDFQTMNKEQNLSSISQERLRFAASARESDKTLSSVNTIVVDEFKKSMNRSSSQISPMYSQPNLPARLYFTPTILYDEQSESVRHVLSPLDQNQTKKEFVEFTKPKVIIRRISHTLLLEHLKPDYVNRMRSIPNGSNHSHQTPLIIPELVSKHRTCPTIENETQSISRTKIRKRKRSLLEEGDIKSNTIALRRRKSVTIIEVKENKRRNNRTTRKKLPIRAPSSEPMIDRSKHYNNRFSTRSQRLNNLSLPIINTETIDDDTNQSKCCSRVRRKPVKSNKSRKR